MTALTHGPWKDSGDKAHTSFCSSCGTRRREFWINGTLTLVQYLVSGEGWTSRKPECFIVGVEQKSLFD